MTNVIVTLVGAVYGVTRWLRNLGRRRAQWEQERAETESQMAEMVMREEASRNGHLAGRAP